MYTMHWMCGCPACTLVSLARLSYPKREKSLSLVKAVLCSCTAQPYLDTLQQSLFCGPQFVYQTTLRTLTMTPAGELCSLWPCIGLVV